MAQASLSSAPGKSPIIGTRIPKEQLSELDQKLANAAVDRSEFMRKCLRYGMHHMDLVLAQDSTEVSAQAS